MDKCQTIIKSKKVNIDDYRCKRPHYKNDSCYQHHPDIILEEKSRRKNPYSTHDKEKLTIESAIKLLLTNGYTINLPGK